MPLRLIKGRHGSPYFYIRGSVRGIRVDESTQTGDPKAAEEIRIRREAELLTLSIRGPQETKTFAEAALDYMQNGGDPSHLAPILRHFQNTPLSKIGQQEIDHAAQTLKPHGSPATRNRHVHTPISAVLHHAARKKWCPKPVIARPKQPPSRIRFLTHPEAHQLIQSAAPHLKPLIIFLLSTGARLSEALYLEWEDVDLAAQHVTFRPTQTRSIKTDTPRGVPLPPEAVEALSNITPRHPKFVFQHPDPASPTKFSPYATRKSLGGGQIKTAWRTALKKARITDFTPHDCRHTWASWHYQANRDIAQLMQLGGWKTPAMVFRYTHLNTSHLAPSQAQIWGKSGDQLTQTPTKPRKSPKKRP